jgi:hypothetical protein
VTGQIGDSTYAFIGLERIGGVVVYDVTNPLAPTFETYFNTRKWGRDPEGRGLGDLGPEGLAFISAAESPNGRPLLAVAHEVSGSTTIFQVVATPMNDGRPMAAMARTVAAGMPTKSLILPHARQVIDATHDHRDRWGDYLSAHKSNAVSRLDTQLVSRAKVGVSGIIPYGTKSKSDTDGLSIDLLHDHFLDEQILDALATDVAESIN